MRGENHPFQELERLFHRIARQLETPAPGDSERSATRPRGTTESMAADLEERADAFVARIDLPGFDREEIDVRLVDRTLRVEAEHDETQEADDGRYLRQERRRRSLHRSLDLPDQVDPDGVRARLTNGVLTVTLPRMADADDARSIDIE